ncbi:MAG: response regulator [Chloroflexi bacterium]|nr:response regulator [Chloroflexota bacterium]
MKIILIEDDSSMQSILQTLLELEGFQVVTAGDRRSESELLDLIRQEQPDIILLDVFLKDGASGIDLLRKVRSDESISKTRVVMTSGMDLRDECIQSGASDFLLKPYMPVELLDKLRAV